MYGRFERKRIKRYVTLRGLDFGYIHFGINEAVLGVICLYIFFMEWRYI